MQPAQPDGDDDGGGRIDGRVERERGAQRRRHAESRDGEGRFHPDHAHQAWFPLAELTHADPRVAGAAAGPTLAR